MAATTVRRRPSPEVVIHMAIFLAVFVRVFSSAKEIHTDLIACVFGKVYRMHFKGFKVSEIADWVFRAH